MRGVARGARGSWLMEPKVDDFALGIFRNADVKMMCVMDVIPLLHSSDAFYTCTGDSAWFTIPGRSGAHPWVLRVVTLQFFTMSIGNRT